MLILSNADIEQLNRTVRECMNVLAGLGREVPTEWFLEATTP